MQLEANSEPEMPKEDEEMAPEQAEPIDDDDGLTDTSDDEDDDLRDPEDDNSND